MDAVAEVLAAKRKEIFRRSWFASRRADFDELLAKHFEGPCKLLTEMVTEESADLDRVRREMTEPKFNGILELCGQVLDRAYREDLFLKFKSELRL